MNIAIVQGTRPEVIKNLPIVKALRKRDLHHLIFHTNQHSEPRMRDSVYREMGYSPDFIQTCGFNLGAAIQWLQKQYKKHNISRVIVNGDTASSLVGSLAAMYSDIELTHVEAGLRARDNEMLEERNRIIVDAVANLLFAYTSLEYELLISTPDIRGKIFVEGNTTVDVIDEFMNRLTDMSVKQQFIYVTLHRRELTRSKSRMERVVQSLNVIANELCDVVFPIHPRTRNALAEFNLYNALSSSIRQSEPVGAIDSLRYQKHSAAVLTDSGCIQEEAYMLGTPCITLRENTERHLTIENGANVLSGFDPDRIIMLVKRTISQTKTKWPEIYGKPGVGDRIVEQICRQ